MTKKKLDWYKTFNKFTAYFDISWIFPFQVLLLWDNALLRAILPPTKALGEILFFWVSWAVLSLRLLFPLKTKNESLHHSFHSISVKAKSHKGTKSGELGGWSKGVIWFLAKSRFTLIALCAGALSWWSHDLSLHSCHLLTLCLGSVLQISFVQSTCNHFAPADSLYSDVFICPRCRRSYRLGIIFHFLMAFDEMFVPFKNFCPQRQIFTTNLFKKFKTLSWRLL